MSPEKQRIAIAEFDGWKRGGMVIEGYGQTVPERTGGGWTKSSVYVAIPDELPDFLHDLNAVRQAWLRLDKRQQIIACFKLTNMCGGTEEAVNATAEQKAEALIRTIGKWEDK